MLKMIYKLKIRLRCDFMVILDFGQYCKSFSHTAISPF